MQDSTSCSTPYSLISFPDNQSNCAALDTLPPSPGVWDGNYGWRFDYYDPPNQTSTTNYLLNLQSYGSDGLPDTIDISASPPYQTDYPANTNLPVIHLQDWLFNLGSAATSLNSGSTQQLQPTSVTINLTHTNFSPTTFTASTISSIQNDIQTVCNMTGGSWSAPNCNVNSTLCETLGGTWGPPGNPSTPTNGTCKLTQLPLQSLCTTGSARGTWNGTNCILTSLSSINCGLLNGTYSSGSCTLPAPPSPTTSCSSFSGSYASSSCSLPAGTTIFSSSGGISGFCSAIGGYWNTTSTPASPYCFIAAPLLPFTPSACISNSSSQCTQNICLNVFYRELQANTPIVVATQLATVQSDGQPHAVSFSGFSVYDLYDLSGNQNPVINNLTAQNPVPIPVGQNAISVTQANSVRHLEGDRMINPPVFPWTNPPYPPTMLPARSANFLQASR